MNQCFFHDLGGCQGRLVKAHLIPKQRIKRELPGVEQAIWDERVWTWMCGGFGYGNAGHHGQFDNLQIRIAREDLPEAVEEYAEDYALVWSLDRDYR